MNAANNPQLRYKNDPLNGFSSGAIVGIHHPASTKNQNSRQFNLKRSIGPQASGAKGGPQASGPNGLAIGLVGSSDAHLAEHAQNEVRSLDRIMD